MGLDLLGPVDPFTLPGNVEVMDDFSLLTQCVISTFVWICCLVGVSCFVLNYLWLPCVADADIIFLPCGSFFFLLLSFFFFLA